MRSNIKQSLARSLYPISKIERTAPGWKANNRGLASGPKEIQSLHSEIVPDIPKVMPQVVVSNPDPLPLRDYRIPKQTTPLTANGRWNSRRRTIEWWIVLNLVLLCWPLLLILLG